MQTDLHTAEWIRSVIEADTVAGGLMDPAGSIEDEEVVSGGFFGIIPSDKKLPAIRFHVQAPHDVRGAGAPAQRIMTQIDWLIAVVTEGRGLAKLVPLADRLDTLFDNVSGETSVLLILSCVRLEPFSLPEEEDTPVGYRHAGGVYRTIVQPK